MEDQIATVQAVNPVAAHSALAEVDNLINWHDNALRQVDKAGIRLSRFIADVVSNEYWKIRGFKNESSYIKGTFPKSESQYYIMRRVGITLRQYPIKILEEIGISKCQDLVRIHRQDGKIEVNWWMLARTCTRDEFRDMVRRYLTKALPPANDLEGDKIVHFRVWKDAEPVFDKSFEIGRKIAGNVDSKSYILNDIILPEFLSGYGDQGESLISENNFHLMMIERHIGHLKIENDNTVLDRLIGVMSVGISKKKDS